jgi:hypothetical protein
LGQKTRLYFSANHDGDWESYIEMLVDKAGPGIEAIFSACEGYPNIPLTDPSFKARFKAYLQAHFYKVNTFYQGYPNKTVREVQRAIAQRTHLEQTLNQKGLDGLKAELQLSKPSPNFGSGIKSLIGRVSSTLFSAITAPIRPWFQKNAPKIANFFLGTFVGVRIFPEKLPTPALPSPEVDTHAEFTDYLDSVQNEMTTISAIDPQQLGALRRMLWIVDKVGRYFFNKGDLSGISTIHFARWVIIDNGKNLLFESNYDGNWEQYIGDFVDKASLGMDSIWGNSAPDVKYPTSGSKDLQVFKKAIIDHQAPAAVFYSAYRYDSIRNIINDLAINNLVNGEKSRAELAELFSRL